MVDGRVSADILEAVFQKGSAVRDGAAIIEGDLVSRVGVILPLTQRARVPEGYGTRHRAGMGLAERSDALVVVVFEERGEVTLMSGDHIRLMPSEPDLVAALNGLTARAVGESSRLLRTARLPDFRLPATALALSALVWTLTSLFPRAIGAVGIHTRASRPDDRLAIGKQLRSVDTRQRVRLRLGRP